MAVGQVGFKDQKMVDTAPQMSPLVVKAADVPQVRKILVTQRENAIINRLNKTKVERFPDLRQEKEDRMKELRERDRKLNMNRVRIPGTNVMHVHILNIPAAEGGSKSGKGKTGAGMAKRSCL